MLKQYSSRVAFDVKVDLIRTMFIQRNLLEVLIIISAFVCYRLHTLFTFHPSSLTLGLLPVYICVLNFPELNCKCGNIIKLVLKCNGKISDKLANQTAYIFITVNKNFVCLEFLLYKHTIFIYQKPIRILSVTPIFSNKFACKKRNTNHSNQNIRIFFVVYYRLTGIDCCS